MSIQLMRLQIPTLIEAFPAARETALVRLLPCVYPNMSLEVEVDGKELVTVRTLERALACVHELMSA